MPFILNFKDLGVIFNKKSQNIEVHNNLLLREQLIQGLPSKLISMQLKWNSKDLNHICKKNKRIKNLQATYDTKIRKAFAYNFDAWKQYYIKCSVRLILTKQKNSKVFVIFMSKWFFILFWLFKFSVKLLVILYVYRKR